MSKTDALTMQRELREYARRVNIDGGDLSNNEFAAMEALLKQDGLIEKETILVGSRKREVYSKNSRYDMSDLDSFRDTYNKYGKNGEFSKRHSDHLIAAGDRRLGNYDDPYVTQRKALACEPDAPTTPSTPDDIQFPEGYDEETTVNEEPATVADRGTDIEDAYINDEPTQKGGWLKRTAGKINDWAHRNPWGTAAIVGGVVGAGSYILWNRVADKRYEKGYNNGLNDGTITYNNTYDYGDWGNNSWGNTGWNNWYNTGGGNNYGWWGNNNYGNYGNYGWNGNYGNYGWGNWS